MVKPLIEIITGEDWIMHTKLTEEQKKLKAMGIFVDVSMFLFSFVTGGESLTAGSLVKALMVEMVTGMSTVGVTRFANSYNLSPGVTMLLMFLVGTFTGVAANSAFDFIEDGVDDWVRNNVKGEAIIIGDDVRDLRVASLPNVKAVMVLTGIGTKQAFDEENIQYELSTALEKYIGK